MNSSTTCDSAFDDVNRRREIICGHVDESRILAKKQSISFAMCMNRKNSRFCPSPSVMELDRDLCWVSLYTLPTSSSLSVPELYSSSRKLLVLCVSESNWGGTGPLFERSDELFPLWERSWCRCVDSVVGSLSPTACTAVGTCFTGDRVPVFPSASSSMAPSSLQTCESIISTHFRKFSMNCITWFIGVSEGGEESSILNNSSAWLRTDMIS
mmetsp:Transcript_4088/g.6337  ORF Transcript_4088/g.6337 Transcript_4088/m.6337 type:complete len:212 (-) Transcript_4088:1859-2494(-)